MQRAFACGTSVLGAIFVICSAGMAQNSPAGQRPAQGNPPAGAQGNRPQQGMARGPAPPVQGPPHDPHDLTGVWNTRRGYGGDHDGPAGPENNPWGPKQI